MEYLVTEAGCISKEIMYDYLEGQLNVTGRYPPGRYHFERHLEKCSKCQQIFEHLKKSWEEDTRYKPTE